MVGAGYADVSAYAYSVPVGNNASDQSAVVFADGTQVTGQTDLGGCQYDAQGVQHCGILEEQLNFRISAASPSQLLFNQPRTFAVVDESFGKASWGPFGIKLDKAIKMFDPTPSTYDNVINDSTKAGRESIFATAQGLAYYHHPGNWREPPNFYNPYWRAKLHPFSSSADVSAVIKSAGYNGNTATDFIKALPVTQ